MRLDSEQADQGEAYGSERKQRQDDGDRYRAASPGHGSDIYPQSERGHRYYGEDRCRFGDWGKRVRRNKVQRTQHDHDEEADDKPGNELVQRRTSAARPVTRSDMRSGLVGLLAKTRS